MFTATCSIIRQSLRCLDRVAIYSHGAHVGHEVQFVKDVVTDWKATLDQVCRLVVTRD
jgi:hypothetical protein